MQTVVQKLHALLESKRELKQAVTTALQQANEPGLKGLADFYQYLDNILTHIPTEEALMPSVRQFYFVLGQGPADILKKDADFNAWVNEFVQARGSFMDTPASTATLNSFINNPAYKIEDYINVPGGWLSYNQFLARQLKPGKRPIAERCNDRVIVSPADSTFMGSWQIAADSTITVKGETYSINTLLAGSKYKDSFNKGIFTHSF